MTIRTRAAIAVDIGQPLIVDHVDLRRPEAGEVLIEMKVSGMCHSDLSVAEGKFPIELPAVLGHEGAGIVIECGAGVTSVSAGDHVILNNTAHCGVCPPCLSQKTGYCRSMAMDGRSPSPFSWRGENLRRFMPAASFAAHNVINADRLTRLSSDIKFETACLIPCGIMTGVGAVLNVAKVEPGAKALVFGMGSIGLNVVQGCKLAGATMIVAIDTNPAKETVAREFGATHFINPAQSGETLDKQVKSLLSGYADYAFDCVGNETIVQQAVSLVSPYWGVMVAVGIPPSTGTFTLPASTFYFGRTMHGTFMGDCNPKTDTNKIIDWYRDGKLLIDSLITHRIPLDEINTGFDLMKAGKSVRSVVVF